MPQIGFGAGKPKRQGQLQKLYYQLRHRGERVCKGFTRALAGVTQTLSAATQLPTSKRPLAAAVSELIGADSPALGPVAATSRCRVVAKEQVPSAEKIVSLSDGDAAFIVKGGWHPEIGYRPQVGKSGQGFVSALLVPPGNAADRGQLIPGVLDHWERTSMLPKVVIPRAV